MIRLKNEVWHHWYFIAIVSILFFSPQLAWCGPVTEQSHARVIRHPEIGGVRIMELVCSVENGCVLSQIKNRTELFRADVKKSEAERIMREFIKGKTRLSEIKAEGRILMEWDVSFAGKTVQGNVSRKEPLDDAVMILDAELSSLLTKKYREKSKSEERIMETK